MRARALTVISLKDSVNIYVYMVVINKCHSARSHLVIAMCIDPSSKGGVCQVTHHHTCARRNNCDQCFYRSSGAHILIPISLVIIPFD
ncbi:hypothetical protein SAMN05216316_1751 [Nitrosovibrio sp. Nv6]|nr:hypothetical protein SAMN05216316_1751 [Nitrosovibrio sp. Nv6]